MSDAPSKPISPKVIAAGVAAFLAPTVLIVLDYLLGEGRGIFAGWPILAQVATFSLLSSVSVVVSGYMKRDPIMDRGALTAIPDYEAGDPA